MSGHVCVDLDGTLAFHDGTWHGAHHIGDPIKPMVDRVKQWLADGIEVRIFTARVHRLQDEKDRLKAAFHVQQWCLRELGVSLPVTCEKDYETTELWDDRAIQVRHNIGEPVIDKEKKE